jgi:hypothetical protein
VRAETGVRGTVGSSACTGRRQLLTGAILPPRLRISSWAAVYDSQALVKSTPTCLQCSLSRVVTIRSWMGALVREEGGSPTMAPPRWELNSVVVRQLGRREASSRWLDDERTRLSEGIPLRPIRS